MGPGIFPAGEVSQSLESYNLWSPGHEWVLRRVPSPLPASVSPTVEGTGGLGWHVKWNSTQIRRVFGFSCPSARVDLSESLKAKHGAWGTSRAHGVCWHGCQS